MKAFTRAAVISYVALGAAAAGLVQRSEVPGFNYDKLKVRGVNVGGWFVLEPYMTPSLFEAFPESDRPLDEFHLSQRYGKDKTKEVLEHHWDTFINETDFETIAKWGFNTLRIPLGYWAFLERPEDPYIQGQLKYFDRAIEWARKYKLMIWLDLHGVPGSQNGFDNSGQAHAFFWQTPWFHNIQDSLKTLTIIRELYGGPKYYDVISGIELVNEPLGPALNFGKIIDYYEKGYHLIREAGSNGVVVHDAFMKAATFNDKLQVPDYWNVVLDHHKYQVFSVPELFRNIDEHVNAACEAGRTYDWENLWRVTGEWSAAMTDCTPWLNGLGKGARYDGTLLNPIPIGSCKDINNFAAWTDQKKKETRRYIEAQMDAYDRGNGWIFWSYKTERTIEWDVRRLVEYGLFPQPLDSRQYPNQCGF